MVSHVPSFQPAIPGAAYRTPLPGRPPVLRAFGASAVVVAVLSMLAGLLTIGYAAGVLLTSVAARQRLLRNAPPAMPDSTADQPVRLRTRLSIPMGKHGLSGDVRSAVLPAFDSLVVMSPQQAGQLDALLAQAGADMFGGPAGRALRAEDVRRQIGDRVGLLASSDGQAFYFETPAGRAEIYPERALFYRANSPVVIRASLGRRLNVSGHPILLPDDVEALLSLTRHAASDGLRDGQELTLCQLLSDPQQKLVALGEGPGGSYIGIDDAILRDDKFAVVIFAGGPLLLDPAGSVVLQTSTDVIPIASPAACAGSALLGIMSIGVATFLMIIGVRLLRSPHVRLRSFYVYAVIKGLVAAAGGAAVGWMTASWLALPRFVQVMPMGSARPEAWGAMVGGALVLLGWVYPVALAIGARSQGVKQYYEQFE